MMGDATVTNTHRSSSITVIGLRRQRTSQCHYGIESIGIVGIAFDIYHYSY